MKYPIKRKPNLFGMWLSLALLILGIVIEQYWLGVFIVLWMLYYTKQQIDGEL